jgi:hypothetical protein
MNCRGGQHWDSHTASAPLGRRSPHENRLLCPAMPVALRTVGTLHFSILPYILLRSTKPPRQNRYINLPEG